MTSSVGGSLGLNGSFASVLVLGDGGAEEFSGPVEVVIRDEPPDGLPIPLVPLAELVEGEGADRCEGAEEVCEDHSYSDSYSECKDGYAYLHHQLEGDLTRG